MISLNVHRTYHIISYHIPNHPSIPTFSSVFIINSLSPTPPPTLVIVSD